MAERITKERLEEIVSYGCADPEKWGACRQLLAYRESGALEALTKAESQLAHLTECITVNPKEDWEKRGSVSFNKCKCTIAKVRLAKARLEAIGE